MNTQTTRKIFYHPEIVAGFLALLVPTTALATTVTPINSIIADFKSVTTGWYSALFVDALGIFAALFAVEFTWLVVTWLIGGRDIHDIYTSFIRKMLTIGFFYSILLYAGRLGPMLIAAFSNAASQAGGVPILSPTNIAMSAIHAFVTCILGGPEAAAHAAGSAWNNLWSGNFSAAASSLGNAASATLSTTTGVSFIAGTIVGFIVFFGLVYVAIEFLAVQLEALLILSVGVIMLGFGAARWTSEFAQNYMKYAFSVGVRILVVTLWAGFVEWKLVPLLKSTILSGGASLESYGIAMLLAMVAGWLTFKLPRFASSILGGGSHLSGGEAFEMAKGAAIMAAAGVAVAATGGAAAPAAGGAAMGATEAAGAGLGGSGAALQGAGGSASAATGVSAGSSQAQVSAGSNAVQAPSSSQAPGMSAQPTQSQTASTGNNVQPPSSANAKPSAPERSGNRPSALHRAKDIIMTAEYAGHAFRADREANVQAAPGPNVKHTDD